MKRFWFTFSFRMAAISLFPAISDDFSVECLRAKSHSSSQTNSVDANFPASLTDSTVLHLLTAHSKIALIPIFHTVECDGEMAFDSFLSPTSDSGDSSSFLRSHLEISTHSLTTSGAREQLSPGRFAPSNLRKVFNGSAPDRMTHSP